MRCRPMSWLLLLVFGLVTLFPVSAQAAEDGKIPANSGSGGGDAAGEWNVLLSIGHLPAADLHGTPGDVGISDYRLKIARNLKLDDRLTLGGGYGLKHLDSSSSVALPQDLRVDDAPFLKVSLDVGW